MERVIHEVENALERERLVSEVRSLRQRLDDETALIGSSASMQKLKEVIARIAPIPSPVLIVGVSGSGKELVARELHRLGPGPKQPFVALNSGALPENLIESELFGHERGAFTGASRTRKGAFEAAGAGTLLLDEIGDLPSAAQAKLLRVLEEHEVTRLGSNKPVPVKARVVAATNRKLEDDVEAGRFRQDLYYRLAVHVIHVPALRERLSDIPQLVEHFISSICARFGVRKKRIGADALEMLMGYDWSKNNVRELRNIVERMIIAADGQLIGIGDVPPEIREGREGSEPAQDKSSATTFKELKAEAERQIVVAALERNDWHITHTAKQLGLADHASLLKIMRRHQLSRE